jgi:hypothetical protein
MGKPAANSIDILGNNNLFVKESLKSFYRSKANLLDTFFKCVLASLNGTTTNILSASVCLLRSAVPCVPARCHCLLCSGPLMRNWTVVICGVLVAGPRGPSLVHEKCRTSSASGQLSEPFYCSRCSGNQP